MGWSHLLAFFIFLTSSIEDGHCLEFLTSMLLVVMEVHQSCVRKEGFTLPVKTYVCLCTKKCAAMKVRLEMKET